VVATALRQAGYETLEVETGLEALEAGRDPTVGLLVLEVALPGMTGYEICHQLRHELGDDLPIFLMSGTRVEPIDRVAGLLLGADDYVTKPFVPAELVARISRFIARRSSALSGNGGVASTVHLTAREREVLTLLTEGRSQKQISYDLTISSKTVGTHIQKLLTKVGAHSRAELVAQAFRTGLVSPADVGRINGHSAPHEA
jgi:DNA-binding NarL/FixJ family response regulator